MDGKGEIMMPYLFQMTKNVIRTITKIVRMTLLIEELIITKA